MCSLISYLLIFILSFSFPSKVVPLYKVRLDDVLNRQHLPPLGAFPSVLQTSISGFIMFAGLKDFEVIGIPKESWMLITYKSAGMATLRGIESRESVGSYLRLFHTQMYMTRLSLRYFILWLREYKRRYKQWKSQNDFQKTVSDAHKMILDGYSTQLAMFYARAKQTFFTPGSDYELNLSSSILSPFHASDAPPYPDPSAFIPVEIETRRMLDDSLRRFVQGQLSNMGNNRIICGIVVGCLICILTATPALTVNFVLGHDRWLRLVALPGLFFGLWLLVASLHGVCLGIYVFGDLRQLRQFELARPVISQPVPLSYRPLRPGVPGTFIKHNSTMFVRRERVASLPGEQHQLQRMPSDSSGVTGGTTQQPQAASFDGHFYISQAYYDADEDDDCHMYHDEDRDICEIPSINDSGWTPEDEQSRDALNVFFKRDTNENDLNCSDDNDGSSSLYTATATFIHPFELNNEEDEKALECPEQLQRIDKFDFDALPKRSRFRGPRRFASDCTDTTPPPVAVPKLTISSVADAELSYSPIPPTPTTAMSSTTVTSQNMDIIFPPRLKLRVPDPRAPPPAPPAKSFIVRRQEDCSAKRFRLQPGYLESENPYSEDDSNRPHSSSAYWASNQPLPRVMINEGTSLPRTSDASASTETDVKKEQETASNVKKEAKVKMRFKKISAVPPFRAPLTRVLSPIIQRGQWEIVIRSAVIGLLLAWMVVGTLLAVPVR